MIIVKTSNGDVLFNDKEIVRLRHDKENHFVYVTHLRHLANDIIQVVNYGDEIPAETRKRLSDIAEESKVYSLDDSKWYERRQYMETHQKQAEDESSHTAMLNEKVEQQAARIRELEAQLDHAKGRLRFCESENKSLQERNNELENLNFWQRINGLEEERTIIINGDINDTDTDGCVKVASPKTVDKADFDLFSHISDTEAFQKFKRMMEDEK